MVPTGSALGTIRKVLTISKHGVGREIVVDAAVWQRIAAWDGNRCGIVKSFRVSLRDFDDTAAVVANLGLASPYRPLKRMTALGPVPVIADPGADGGGPVNQQHTPSPGALAWATAIHSQTSRGRNVRGALELAARLARNQACGGLYSVLVWLACFIAASAS